MKRNRMIRGWLVGMLVAMGVATGVVRGAGGVDKIERAFTMAPGGRVVLDVDRGGVRVSGGEGDRVEVVVIREVTGGSESRREELLKAHEVSFEESAGMVSVRARMREGWRAWGRRGNLGVRYELVVPAKSQLELRTAGGEIRVSGVTGGVRAQTAGGGLHFERLEGSVDGRTSGGGIEVQQCKGDLALQTAGGGIRLQGVSGRCEARTSGGSIRATGVRGAIQALTAGGSVAVEFDAAPEGDCTLETSGGGVTVVVPEGAAFVLDARTSAGRVSSELPVTTVVSGEVRRGELSGKVNGGGPVVRLRTSGGGIEVRKR